MGWPIPWNSLSAKYHPNQPILSIPVTGEMRKLSLEIELNSYRIVSELVHNVIKHAKATRASVHLHYYPHLLKITVEDDGMGERFGSPHKLLPGMGLKNITARAKYIGASVVRESGVIGMCVAVEIPFDMDNGEGGMAV